MNLLPSFPRISKKTKALLKIVTMGCSRGVSARVQTGVPKLAIFATSEVLMRTGVSGVQSATRITVSELSFR